MMLKDRIRKLRGSETQAAFGERFGKAQTTVGRWERGAMPDPDELLCLARLAGVTVERFLTDDDVMIYPAASGKDGEGLSSGVVVIEGEEYAALGKFDAELSAGPGSLLPAQPKPLGYHLVENQWLRAITASPPQSLTLLRVSGDSMEDTLSDGDWVLVDREQTNPAREGIYALRVDDVAWVKRISVNRGTEMIRIISDNPRWGIQEWPGSAVQILGRVVWLMGRKVV